MSGSGGPSPRRDGWAPLEAYAVLGDGRGVALVADDGSIDWWPVPTIDAPPICDAILDPGSGGSFVVRPADATARTTRRYLPGTNVVETTWHTDAGVARVTDALVTGKAGRLPWTELARRVEGVEGTVEMCWTFEPGDLFGAASPWAALRGDIGVVRVGDQTVALLVSAVDGGSGDGRTRRVGASSAPAPDEGPAAAADDDDDTASVGAMGVTHRQLSGTVTVHAGQRAVLAAVASDHEPLYLSAPSSVDRRLNRTVTGWKAWTDELVLPSRWTEAVKRSALALKTLLYEPGGAIAAAATTSLPETLGGGKNWDYRYSWVRDSSFTVNALISLDLHEEVQAAVSWLLGALRRSAPEMHIFYALGGEPPSAAGSATSELDVPGYRNSRPVRAGNTASAQIQLGVYGDLFDTMWRYAEGGHLFDRTTAVLLETLAEQCCDQWRRQDAGIWELGDPEHYTYSKMGCWVALDRACRLADAGQLSSRNVDRWKAEASAIHDWVDEHCWSTLLGSYTMAAGSDRLDAACVLAGRNGFDRGERLAGTVDAVTATLRDGALVWRYSGMPEEEGAFVACTFWMAEALAHIGRVDDASALMDEAVATLPNDVGILAEQADPSGAALGNLPQALSHLALVEAAFAIDKALGPDRSGDHRAGHDRAGDRRGGGHRAGDRRAGGRGGDRRAGGRGAGG